MTARSRPKGDSDKKKLELRKETIRDLKVKEARVVGGNRRQEYTSTVDVCSF